MKYYAPKVINAVRTGDVIVVSLSSGKEITITDLMWAIYTRDGKSISVESHRSGRIRPWVWDTVDTFNGIGGDGDLF